MTATAIAAGGQNLVNLISGGVVTPSNPTVLYLGLTGVVFLAYCQIAQSLLPFYTHYVERPVSQQSPQAATAPANVREAAAPVAVAPDRVALQAGVLGHVARGASGRLGASAFANVRQQPRDLDQFQVAQER